MVKQRIAIIGGVASGTAAAAEARRVDADARIVLFEKGEHISYGACEIPLFLDGTVEDKEKLIAFTPARFEAERGVAVQAQTIVRKIDPRSGLLEYERVDTGEIGSDRFDKFILATGARAIEPEISGVDAANVFSIRTLEDAARLKKFLQKTDVKHAVVVGGGFVGIEVAESLTHRGIRVTLLQPQPGPLHRHLEDDMAGLVEELLVNGGVTVRHERLLGFEMASSGRVNAVKADSGELIGCGLVILAMGIMPNTDIGVSASVKLGESGGYRVDDGMKTNVSNVWACGDCVEVLRLIDGKRVISPLSLTAFKTGRVAGRNAVRRGGGKPVKFEGVTGAQGVRVFDGEVAYLGLTVGEAQGAGFSPLSVSIRHRTKAALAPGSAPIHVTLVFDATKGRILGAQLIGGAGTVLRGNVLIPLIRRRASVFELYEQDLIYAPPFSPRLDPLLVAARSAMKLVVSKRS